MLEIHVHVASSSKIVPGPHKSCIESEFMKLSTGLYLLCL